MCGLLLLELGLTSVGRDVVVDHEVADGRPETPSSTNDSPEARKDWPGWGWCVDGDGDEVAADGAVEDVGEVGDAADAARKDWPGSQKECTTGLTGMGAICILYVPGARRSGRVVVKVIGFPFVASTGARTLRDQGQRGLQIFLLDTTRTARTGAIYPTGRGLLVVVTVMVLLLWWLRLLLMLMLQVVGVARCIRDGVR